ncbi:MAG: hypothetical protein EON58_23170 [Alphaproteobacteria bacterium]|nr:MAG: hypothetical protein EON58_23170 [Alphaproteobacteria bacterium]
MTAADILRYSSDQERALAEQCEDKAIREGHLAKYLTYSAMADIFDGPRKQEFFASFGVHVPSPAPRLTLVALNAGAGRSA